MDLHSLTCSCDASFPSVQRVKRTYSTGDWVLLKMQPTAAHAQTQLMLKQFPLLAFLLCKLYITQVHIQCGHVSAPAITAHFHTQTHIPTHCCFFPSSSQVILAPRCHDVILWHCNAFCLAYLSRLFPLSSENNIYTATLYFFLGSFMESLLSLTLKADVHLSHYLVLLHPAHRLRGWQPICLGRDSCVTENIL